MAAFPPEQAEILKALLNVPIEYAGSLAEILQEQEIRVAAMTKLLVEKGLLTREELRDSMQEIRAGVMVEKALRPEPRKVEDEVDRVLRGETPKK